MPDVAIANETIFPTANDVAQTAGEGETLMEKKLYPWVNKWNDFNFVLTGFVLPASSANLDLNIPPGEAWISGFHVIVPGATTITFGASVTSHLFLKLIKVSTLVTEAKFEHNTTGAAPDDSVYIGTVTTSGSAVTSTQDCRPLSGQGRLNHHPDELEEYFEDFRPSRAFGSLGVGTSNHVVNKLPWFSPNTGGDFMLNTATDDRAILTVSGANAYLGRYADASTVWLLANPAKGFDLRFRFATMAASARTRRIGLGATTAFEANVANGIFLRFTNGNISFVTRSASSETATDTGIASATTFKTCRILMRSGRAECYLDGALVATHTTNVPTVSMGFAFGISSADVEGLALEWFHFLRRRTA
jgi:uncharacterized protein with putative carbohydrate binding module